MLKKILLFKEDPCGKFRPNFESPYLVNKVLSSGVSILSRIDKDVLLESCNSDSVETYFI